MSNSNQLPNIIMTALLREGVAGANFCDTSGTSLFSVSQHRTIPGSIPKYIVCVSCLGCFSNAKLLQSVGVCFAREERGLPLPGEHFLFTVDPTFAVHRKLGSESQVPQRSVPSVQQSGH